MKVARDVFLAALILLAVGCASHPRWESENVPMPRSTPYDANEFARNAYLEGFRSGYRAESSGMGAPVDLMTPPNVHARRLGYHAGAAAARSERARKE
jgi:hypothetical protein